MVEVDIEVTRPDEKSPWLVRIRDNGAGVHPSRRAELFDRIEHLVIHGSGLGLPLVKLLVQRCGGSIWLESPAGAGAVFALGLPAA